jgi:hypothetical protein
MTCRLLVLLVPLAAAPLAAQEMTPQAFQAFSVGRTLHFTLNGAPFGAEQYFDGRRSLWRFADGTCQAGRWWDEGDRICFDYGESPSCWRLRGQASGFAAALVERGAETGFVLELERTDQTPLPCPGPDVGM